MELKFDEKGLIPAIVQDHYTKEVLTLAYMNAETLALTIAEGRTVLLEPEPSGDLAQGRDQRQRAAGGVHHRRLRRGRPGGGSGKSGPRLPHRRGELLLQPKCMSPPELKQFSWQGLYDLIKGRKTSPKEGSYTTYLFEKGKEKILKKVGEECTEVIIAGEKEDNAETIYEISDLAYHVLVLMVQAGITVEDITRELEKRHVIDHKVKQERMQ